MPNNTTCYITLHDDFEKAPCTIYKMNGRSLSVYKDTSASRVSLYTDTERTRIL